jgi:hypothetical protein
MPKGLNADSQRAQTAEHIDNERRGIHTLLTFLRTP